MHRTIGALLAAFALATAGCQQQLSLDAPLATGEQGVTSIAVDDGFVYWTRADGTVRRVSLDTGQVSTVGTRAGATGTLPQNLVLDDAFLYWSVGSDIVKAPKAGGALEVHTQPAQINAISLDDQNLYWSAGDGRIIRAAKGSLVADTLATASHPKPILAGTASIYAAAENDSGVILQILPTGSVPDQVATQTGEVLALAQDLEHIYWGTFANDGSNGTVNMMVPGGGDPKPLASGQRTPAGMLSDAVHLYWSNVAGEIHALPIAGGDPQRIVAGPESCEANLVGARVSIAMDANNIYWANGCDDAILTMPRL